MATQLPLPEDAIVQQIRGAESHDDPLLQALAQYVTTGPNTRHATDDELRELVATAVSRPGGRAHLESLVRDDDDFAERRVWRTKADCSGSINMSKTSLNIELRAPSLDIDINGEIAGFFRPFTGSLNGGILYHNEADDILPGPVDFKMRVDRLTLNIAFYRDGAYIAAFACGPITFMLPPHQLEGSGNIF